MRLGTVFAALFAGGLLATCAAPADIGGGSPPVVETVRKSPDLSKSVQEVSPGDALWRASDAASALIAASCPAGTRYQAPLPIDLTVTPATLGTPDQIAHRIPETVTISGAWELTSSNSNLGGLSGLALVPASEGGGLLTVSDAGAFVWIDLKNGAPSAAKIAYMQGTDGSQLTGKSQGDAEGLVWSDGLALVSFERDFRVEAFALSACGSAARAARVATLPGEYSGRNIDENQGPEALFLEPDGTLGFGFEGMLGVSPLGEVLTDARSQWTGEKASAPALHGLVGREIVPLPDGTSITLDLYRAWDPVQGNRIRLTWGDEESDRLTLSRPLLVDNFEGLAAEVLENGAMRVWIVSDNNFAGNQKTLLYAFDIAISQG